MPFEIIQSDTHIDFIGKRQLAALISGGLIIASLIAIPIRGVNLGVDFAGGTEIQIQFGADAPAGEGTIRELVGAMGVQGASVVRYGEPDSGAFLIKFQGNINEAPEADEGAEPELANASVAKNDVIVRIQKGLTDSIGPVSIERVDFVGPRVGEGLRRDGLNSLLLASFLRWRRITCMTRSSIPKCSACSSKDSWSVRQATPSGSNRWIIMSTSSASSGCRPHSSANRGTISSGSYPSTFK